MTTYIGLVLNKAISSVEGRAPLYQEVVVEVKAFDESSARQAIKGHAKEQETRYENEAGDVVTWSFEKIIDVSVLLEENFANGVRELHARHFKDFEFYSRMDNSV